jgi:MarR family transcriptional regulator, lower aerobic nicotinate degradation pathway regulator
LYQGTTLVVPSMLEIRWASAPEARRFEGMLSKVKNKSFTAVESQPATVNDFHTLPGYLVRRTQQISTALFAAECGQHDLTAVQYASLVAIFLHPLIDATRISQFISLDRSTLGNVLERIEAKGWVIRTASPSDKRIKLLSLTEKGTQLLFDVQAAVQRVQERLLEPLTPTDRSSLLRLLTRITHEHADVAIVS